MKERKNSQTDFHFKQSLSKLSRNNLESIPDVLKRIVLTITKKRKKKDL